MTTRFVVVARTSGDEEDTGQDVQAQARQVREDGEARDWACAGVYLDDGVSGAVPPLERPGFVAAANAVRLGHADVILIRDWSRLDRRHPFRAGDTYLYLIECGIRIEATRDRALPQKPADEWDLSECIIAAIAFSEPYAYRLAVRRNTQHAMDDLRSGRRVTKSGKAVGRPQKFSDDEIRSAYPVAVQQGVSAAARWLSTQRGAHEALTAETRRKRSITHSTLIERFQALGLDWPVQEAA